MRTFDVQAVEIECPVDEVFEFLSDPTTLPDWTSAFQAVSGGRATLVTPSGSVEVDLDVRASGPQGTVDWLMTFADGSVARACSRVIEGGPGRSIYTFVLTAPPVPLEVLEGTLDEQSPPRMATVDRGDRGRSGRCPAGQSCDTGAGSARVDRRLLGWATSKSEADPDPIGHLRRAFRRNRDLVAERVGLELLVVLGLLEHLPIAGDRLDHAHHDVFLLVVPEADLPLHLVG